jgi:NAD(P)-dependent dehydrogenase (short-subunit alcohol dehydrogenase family)
MKDLAGKTAFITGAASGIGLGVSTALAQAGVKVMMCDIEQSALDAAVEGLKRTNADVAGVIADVSLKAELQAAADKTLETYGAVHIIHNNAGVGGSGTYGAWNDAGWSWTIGVNLMAVIWGVEIFGPLIEQAGGGHIVSTASIAGLISGSANAYNVTKYGVVALSEGLRNELAPRGIGVSVLCPGFIRTNITSSGRNLPERFKDAAIIRTPASGQASQGWSNVRERVASGIDPLYVGELVREGIENDWPYIFTDTEFEAPIAARFGNIKAGFDRVREREPRR